jgi:hypothetical protein
MEIAHLCPRQPPRTGRSGRSAVASLRPRLSPFASLKSTLSRIAREGEGIGVHSLAVEGVEIESGKPLETPLRGSGSSQEPGW